MLVFKFRCFFSCLPSGKFTQIWKFHGFPCGKSSTLRTIRQRQGAWWGGVPARRAGSRPCLPLQSLSRNWVYAKNPTVNCNHEQDMEYLFITCCIIYLVIYLSIYLLIYLHTVDGRNPAPPKGCLKLETLKIITTYQMVQDFFHPQFFLYVVGLYGHV